MKTGIPTTYRYNAMRSRLEARWAHFFDLLGWQWVYEPIDADGYIPDFLIQGPAPFFVEVGPCITHSDYEAKTAKPDAAAASVARDLLVVGVSPTPGLASDHDASTTAGLLGQFEEWAQDGIDEPDALVPGFAWDAGQWTVCLTCRRPGIYHSVQSYTVRPCGHYDGGANHGDVDPASLVDLWAQAGSRVQWKPAA